MLQQTQVATVIPYYQRWMNSFPNIKILAQANYNDVLKHWEGLGYYSRCKNIHLTAKSLNGKFPETFNELIKLPGIGEYTAKTILAIAYNQQEVGIDTNLERVGFRLLGLKKKSKFNRNRVKKFLEDIQDKSKPGDFNQALMDLGSSFCQAKTVHCDPCPITSECKATLNDNPLEYPETKKNKAIPTINVAVCIIFYNSKLLLMQRPQNKMLGGLWEFPGGKIKLGEPKNKEKFINLLDGELRKINSDYDAKRYKDIAIKQPKIHFVRTGFFDYWLKSKGKLGGQNKIPRLSNDRKYLDSMLEHISLFQ